jgi:hypothetical protein
MPPLDNISSIIQSSAPALGSEVGFPVELEELLDELLLDEELEDELLDEDDAFF